MYVIKKYRINFHFCVEDISVGGQCPCHGHASECPVQQVTFFKKGIHHKISTYVVFATETFLFDVKFRMYFWQHCKFFVEGFR
jgi:hypothetical protein